MVMGLAAMGAFQAAQPLIAALSGGAFGYAYGYNVRRGYHDFKPSKNPSTTAKLNSLDISTQSAGAGELAAEQRFADLPGQNNPQIQLDKALPIQDRNTFYAKKYEASRRQNTPYVRKGTYRYGHRKQYR